MNLPKALAVAAEVHKSRSSTVEQIRMGSAEDRDSYSLYVRLKDGSIYQVDEPQGWPPPSTLPTEAPAKPRAKPTAARKRKAKA